ncbi:MAG: DUF3127 domain-containing protein [Amoebophilaceae bacterium]|jgi:hypothetical protein|nr:DUF3127 domain-containing protein [Amoebophilaceae bacterium]
MKVTGRLLEIQETQQVSDSFKKRAFVLEHHENPQYPEYVSFELIQDRCSLLDDFQPGQDVEVSFNLKGRKWLSPDGVTKYFNTLQAWRIEAVTQGNNQISAAEKSATGNTVTEDDEDDLPF